jgi:hypothetical protein
VSPLLVFPFQESQEVSGRAIAEYPGERNLLTVVAENLRGRLEE